MNVSADIQKPRVSDATTFYDAVIVGAGPYGLSVAAHLLGRGLNIAVFGKPLQLWREHMPEGMLLRSYWWATNLSDPLKKYRLARYFQAHHMAIPDPLPREVFIDYGSWFQRQAVPDVDETFVAAIQRVGGEFELALEDGRVVRSRAVVMAPGLRYYTYSPEQYSHLPPDCVSHTSAHTSFKQFAGKHVVVIGGGQSALETAAFLYESDAQVDLISRGSLHWLAKHSAEDRRPLVERIRRPMAGIAPGWFNWGLEHAPYAFQMMPRSVKDRLLHGRGYYGPAGSDWLQPRVLGKVGLHERVGVQNVRSVKKNVALELSSGHTLKADHIILATGYRVNVKRLPMLGDRLSVRIRTYQDAPVLNNQFESSVPGLYFLGISSLLSCGPLYRFVVGTDAAASRVAGAIARKIAHVK